MTPYRKPGRKLTKEEKMGGKNRTFRYQCPTCGKKFANAGVCDCRITLRRIRTGKSKILWTGDDGSGPIRAIAVDEDTSAPVPCLIIFERGQKDTVGKISWRSIGDSFVGGPNNLERRLAYELGIALGTLPEWAKEDE